MINYWKNILYAKWLNSVDWAKKQLPTRCLTCGQASLGHALCTGCQANYMINWQSTNCWRCNRCALFLPATILACPDCARRQTWIERTVCAMDYVPPNDALIWQLKNQKQFAHAPLLAELIYLAIIQNHIRPPYNTILVPIPSSQRSLIYRGFNPANEIAKSLAKKLKLKNHYHLLKRHPNFDKQSQLSRQQRADNAQHLFYCTQNLDGLHIAVVDDVMTTGSTLNHAAQVLKQAGASSVIGLVVARAHYPNWQQNSPLIRI